LFDQTGITQFYLRQTLYLGHGNHVRVEH